jgi:hypothetical protein
MVPSSATGDEEMTKSETNAPKGKLKGELQPAVEKLDAPISLTPEQLEGVAAGMIASSGGGRGATTGFAPMIKPY